MDNFGVDFTVSSSPPIPAPVAPPVEETGPTALELLEQKYAALEQEHQTFRSNKDSEFSNMKQQLDLLNTTLQDQLASRPPTPTQEATIPQEELGNSSFWDNFFPGQGATQTPQQAPQQQAPPTEDTMEPKQIKKIAREEVKALANKAFETQQAAAAEAEQLKQHFATNYQHLHGLSNVVTEAYNSLSQAAPSLSQTDRFNEAIQLVERLYPNGAQTSTPSAPSIPSGGQGGMMSTRNTGQRPMLNGFPVRDANATMNAQEQYMRDRATTLQRRKS